MAVASPSSPIRSVPLSQTMELDASILSDAVSDPSSSADHSDGLHRSLSPPRDFDLQSVSKSEEYRQLFRLPPEVALIQDFNCALQESILLQGHMYLFDHYICFYSNIFGFETKKIIPLNEITIVRRARTAGIFPNAIEIVASGKKHFFASFLSRDEAFRLIEEGWSQHSNGARGINDQESKSETGSQSNGTVSIENSESSELQLNPSDGEERVLTVPVIEDRKLLQNSKDSNMDPSTSGSQDILDKDQKLVTHADSSISESSNKWEEETLDDPKIPKHYRKVAESKFPIKVEDFFNLFFSDDAVGFIESFRKRCGDKDFKCTEWSSHDKLEHAREMTFQHPIKVYFGAKCGGCKELQSYKVYKNSHLVIQTSQEVSDVPYADYFRVEGLWDVQRDDSQVKDGCILRIYVNVAFSKRTVWKNKIEQSTMDECREAFSAWIELAHELLKQKNLQKSEGIPGAANVQSLVGSSGRTIEPSGRQYDDGKLSSVADASPDLQGSQQQTQIFFSSKLFDFTTILSSLGEVSAKFCSFLKSQGELQRLSIIVLAVILVLMQLSIVVLLSRPQQIYVIPQASPGNAAGLGHHPRGAETISWLEKRVHLLNDETLVVETQLERMRHEYILLKKQLEEFEHLNNKQR